MKRTIIEFPSGNTAVHLEPDDGYKYVTDGTTFSESVTLGKNASEELWRDTNDDPPEPEDEVTAEEIKAELEAIL